MKKILFVIITTLCVYSCTPKEFIIEGKTQTEALDGTTIFLKQRINRVWTSIDSTIIENKKFMLKGVFDSAKIAYLEYEYPLENRIRQAFVLENGNLTVSIDTTGFMTFAGTAQNIRLQSYQNEVISTLNNAVTFYNKLNDSSITVEKRLYITKKLDSLNNQEIKTNIKYSIDNINTLVGTHIFTNSFYGMTTDEKDSIVRLMNDETKNTKRISEIIADLATEKRVAVGNHYSDFKLQEQSGDSISLSDFVGKSDYLLVDFWASWCGPCIRSLPELKTLYNKYKGDRFDILGVSLDDDKNAWINAIQSHKLSWNHISDLKGWKCEGSRTYAVNSIPNTVLINKEGQIVGRNLSLTEIEKILDIKGMSKQ